MEKGAKLAATLQAAKINVVSAMVFGAIVHINSYEKYRAQIIDLMTSAGFAILKESNGAHMDGTSGYRISFRLAA